MEVSGYKKVETVLELRQVFASTAFNSKEDLVFFLKSQVPDDVWKAYSDYLPMPPDRRSREDYAEFMKANGLFG